MKQPVFEGLATALITPFRNGSIDYPTLDRLLDYQLAGGVDAVVICGTTGESAAMSDEEQFACISHSIHYVNRRCKIIAGTGSNDTAHCLALSRAAACAGADALLAVTPYYNKCTQSGLIAHYTAIADAVDVPLIIYNVPSRTGMDVSAETCEILAEHPNVNGIKEASGSLAKGAEIRTRCQDRLHLWSGNDDIAVPMMSIGAKGLISVLSNLRPKETMQMIHACLDGDFAKASSLQLAMTPLVKALFCEVSPIPIKAAMNMAGFDVGQPRLPLTPLSEDKMQILQELIA